uniref:Death domain-containing protein n=1 Tax=Amphimedon queenslandica TaxID=400682 RepID=A0A1X7TLK4_AMPQE
MDIVKYLIDECHCNPMATNNRGETVLHRAAGHIDIVKYLINECHCDPMATKNSGETVLHCAAGHIDIVKYLINECHCDPMVTDSNNITILHKAAINNSSDVIKYLIDEWHHDPMTVDRWGWTPLHFAAHWGNSAAVEYLLSTGKCDLMSKDNYGNTPFKLAKENDNTDTLSVFKKFGDIKSSHPIDSYVNVLLVGNPGAGKSTLSHVINDTATGPFVLGSFRNVGEVVPCTAGIIPYKLQHRTLCNIILHDFAGHSEYYSSHSAVIENLLQGSGGVFLIVVNILEKEPLKQLHQWLTVVRNEAQKALNQCHVIVIVSHVDEISNPVERRRRKEEIQEIIVRERCDSVFLDCRKLGGSGVNSFFNKLSSACESIRSTSGKNLSLYCHMMYGLLEERKENILTLSDVMSAGKDNDDYFIPDKREDILDVLHSLHSTGLISVLKSEDKVWIVVNKGILLTEVNGILFAPETFKEHVDIASNTGIVSMSGLTRLFPKYDPDMLIRFLKNMELCEEISPSFLRMTNLHQLALVEEEEQGGREKRGERLLHFPCLLSTDRPDEMTSQVYQFGWCLQCTSKHQFFTPRYFHVLALRLAYKMALPQEDDKLKRCCTFWKNGFYWSNGHGIGSLVEIVDESQCVLVMMSFKEHIMMSVGRDVIGEVMSVYKESCPSLEVKELVIGPKELAYPVNTPRERTVYSVKAVLLAVVEKRPFLVTTGTRHTELKEILPDESLSDISNLSLLGGRDIKEVIEVTEEFKTPLTPIKLDIKDLDIVIKELTSDQHLPCSVWHRLGLQLGLYDPRLVDIDKKNKGDPVECFRECMSAWLRGEDKVREKKGPSWSSLAIALDTIEEKSIASYIRNKYCTSNKIIYLYS